MHARRILLGFSSRGGILMLKRKKEILSLPLEVLVRVIDVLIEQYNLSCQPLQIVSQTIYYL